MGKVTTDREQNSPYLKGFPGVDSLREPGSYSGLIKCVLLLIIAPVLLWGLSLRKTIDLYHRNRQSEVRGISLKTDKGQGGTVALPKAQESYLSTGKILDVIASYTAGEKVSILRYTPCLTGSEGNFNLYTGTLVLSGGYTALLKTVSLIERSSLPLQVVSVDFHKQKQPKDKSEILLLTIILQQLEGQTFSNPS